MAQTFWKGQKVCLFEAFRKPSLKTFFERWQFKQIACLHDQRTACYKSARHFASLCGQRLDSAFYSVSCWMNAMDCYSARYGALAHASWLLFRALGCFFSNICFDLDRSLQGFFLSCAATSRSIYVYTVYIYTYIYISLSIYIHTYVVYIYIYMYICICKCMPLFSVRFVFAGGCLWHWGGLQSSQLGDAVWAYLGSSKQAEQGQKRHSRAKWWR